MVRKPRNKETSREHACQKENFQITPDVGFIVENVLVPITSGNYPKNSNHTNPRIFRTRSNLAKIAHTRSKPTPSFLRAPSLSLKECGEPVDHQKEKPRKFQDEKTHRHPGNTGRTCRPKKVRKDISSPRRECLEERSKIADTDEKLLPSSRKSSIPQRRRSHSVITILKKELSESDFAEQTKQPNVVPSSSKCALIDDQPAFSVPDDRFRVQTRDLNYSWEDLSSWASPRFRAPRTNVGFLAEERTKEIIYPCKIKYSWQVIGRSLQTSHILLENLTNKHAEDEAHSLGKYQCTVKYSWQIVGTGTQTNFQDSMDKNCRHLAPTPSNSINAENNSDNRSHAYTYRAGKRFLILNNQHTQTCAHENIQTNFVDISLQ